MEQEVIVVLSYTDAQVDVFEFDSEEVANKFDGDTELWLDSLNFDTNNCYYMITMPACINILKCRHRYYKKLNIT